VLDAMEKLAVTGCNSGSRPVLPSGVDRTRQILTPEHVYNYDERARSSAG
jgi:hypothetical protein